MYSVFENDILLDARRMAFIVARRYPDVPFFVSSLLFRKITRISKSRFLTEFTYPNGLHLTNYTKELRKNEKNMGNRQKTIINYSRVIYKSSKMLFFYRVRCTRLYAKQRQRETPEN